MRQHPRLKGPKPRAAALDRFLTQLDAPIMRAQQAVHQSKIALPSKLRRGEASLFRHLLRFIHCRDRACHVSSLEMHQSLGPPRVRLNPRIADRLGELDRLPGVHERVAERTGIRTGFARGGEIVREHRHVP